MKMATGPKDALFLTALLSLCDNFIFLIFSICSFTVKMSSHACTLQLFWTFNISGCCGTWLWLFREISWGNRVLLFPFTQRQHCHYIKHKRNPCIPDWFRCWRRDDVLDIMLCCVWKKKKKIVDNKKKKEETMWKETHPTVQPIIYR